MLLARISAHQSVKQSVSSKRELVRILTTDDANFTDVSLLMKCNRPVYLTLSFEMHFSLALVYENDGLRGCSFVGQYSKTG
jgi:hypothetical protein